MLAHEPAEVMDLVPQNVRSKLTEKVPLLDPKYPFGRYKTVYNSYEEDTAHKAVYILRHEAAIRAAATAAQSHRIDTQIASDCDNSPRWNGKPPPGYDFDDEPLDYDDIDWDNAEQGGRGEWSTMKLLVMASVGMLTTGFVFGMGTWWAIRCQQEGNSNGDR